MKHLLKILTVLIINSASVSSCYAQYITSFGVRAGKFASGFDVKHFFDANGRTGAELFAGYTGEAAGGYTSRAFVLKQMTFNKAKHVLRIPIKGIIGAGVHGSYFRDQYYG